MNKLNAFVNRLPKNPERVIWTSLIESLPLYKLTRSALLGATKDQELADLAKECYGLHSVQPVDRIDTYNFNIEYLASHFLSKIEPENGTTALAKENAQRTFLSYERHCRNYNRTGISALSFSHDPEINLYFGRMQSFIRKLLGDHPDRKQIMKNGRHGPGASTGSTSQFGHRYYKNSTVPYDVSTRALPFARYIIKHDERWVRALEDLFSRPFREIPNSELFTILDHERIEFVPKKPEIARTIGIGPAMNLWLQLGVDGVMKGALKSIGVNLSDQQINKDLARKASLDNKLSTIDLRGASDTVSLAIVEKLFPLDWVIMLDTLRLDTGVFPDGTVCRYEKLSAMGNGTTFAVESLLFAAAMHAVAPELSFGSDMHVYGDDIIFPTDKIKTLIRLLEMMGFMVNSEKSFFLENYTRESCGGDYINGTDVRPVFLRKHFSDMSILEYVALHNQLYIKFSKLGIIDPPVCRKLRSWVKPHINEFGPPGLDAVGTYFFVPQQPSDARRIDGVYRFNVFKIHIKTFAVRDDDSGYFHVMNNELKDSKSHVHEYSHLVEVLASGDQTMITRRNGYKVYPSNNKRRGRALVWPANPHEL